MTKTNSLCMRSTSTDVALLLSRIGVGVIFVAHALLQLQIGVASLARLLGPGLGFPLPNVFAWLTIFIELFGGIALIIGVATPIAAVLLSIIAVISIVTVKARLGLIARTGTGAELELALLVGTISTAFQGAGRYSVDRKLRWFGYSTGCCLHDAHKTIITSDHLQ